MTIQWFPGHMQETEKFLKKAVSSVDTIMEILDARLPYSSANPLLDKICKNVFRLKILNKQDLADPDVTLSWLHHYRDIGENAIAVTGTSPVETWRAAEYALAGINRSKSRRIRVMVAGIPNTGKSTIMNSLAGKKIAKTGNTPAITRHQQRTSLKKQIDIYDTPGILWPILENKNGAYRLAVSGAISDTAIDYSDIAMFAIALMIKRYPERLKQRYGISIQEPENSQSADFEETEPLKILEEIGTTRGCLKKGGVIDYQKASELFIRELRAGKLGRISFETNQEAMEEQKALLEEWKSQVQYNDLTSTK
ncbi:Ribosome biogenesis GTPase A [Desulfamplus magnetovallimortis]|uniref:Ribosome biogenesis GTPase A n=1 Tax=Desulfamplus magnetovallimortis TaxID=1246637 RepID=A0A1W1H660_9BACT|nr:ribosome biogenesis GTPase YlqF [Desulfamplus magnetovallimortis]SLM27924.1 Ribosome biogenesis GTPase A [Desulfamplus magnetovallimortis]